MGELRQFSLNFIVVSCTQYKVYGVSQSCNDVHCISKKTVNVHAVATAWTLLTCDAIILRSNVVTGFATNFGDS